MTLSKAPYLSVSVIRRDIPRLQNGPKSKLVSLCLLGRSVQGEIPRSSHGKCRDPGLASLAQESII